MKYLMITILCAVLLLSIPVAASAAHHEAYGIVTAYDGEHTYIRTADREWAVNYDVTLLPGQEVVLLYDDTNDRYPENDRWIEVEQLQTALVPLQYIDDIFG